MATIALTQVEADALIALEKHRVDGTEWDYPQLGGRLTLPLFSADGRERFYLDINRSRINFGKGTCQNRARRVIIFARLDFGGAPHRNPDGQEIGSPHLHLYREGFADKWAFPVPVDRFPTLNAPRSTLNDFMAFCNVVKPPIIRMGPFA